MAENRLDDLAHSQVILFVIHPLEVKRDWRLRPITYCAQGYKGYPLFRSNLRNASRFHFQDRVCYLLRPWLDSLRPSSSESSPSNQTCAARLQDLSGCAPGSFGQSGKSQKLSWDTFFQQAGMTGDDDIPNLKIIFYCSGYAKRDQKRRICGRKKGVGGIHRALETDARLD